MEGEGDAAEFTILITVTISRVDNIVHVLRIQGDETQTMGYELICQHGCIRLYLHQVYCYGRDLGEDSSAQGVGEGEINAL
jgi:hypothetical protein